MARRIIPIASAYTTWLVVEVFSTLLVSCLIGNPVTKRGLVVPVQDLARNKGRICLVSDIGADRKTTLLRFGFGLWFWFFWLEGQRHFALPRQGQTKLQVVEAWSVR